MNEKTLAHENALNAQVAAAYAALLGLLSRALLRPDLALAHDARTGSFGAAIAELVDASADSKLAGALDVLASCAHGWLGADDEEVHRELEVDYNRLFVGPAALLAPPYESYYASMLPNGKGGRLRTQDEAAVRSAYRRWGYTAPEVFIDLPDHIAVELGFLALLARDESAAWEVGDAQKATGLQQAGDEFAAQHPGTWVARCAARVDNGAREGFYPAVLRIATVLLAG